MTKKSHGRLQRDAQRAAAKAQLENNACYDDLNTLHQQCTTMLLQHVGISELAKQTEIIAFVADKVTLINNIRTLGNDLRTMSDELKEIKTTHEGKTGGSKDPEMIMGTITIYEQYHLFVERHNAVIMPTVYHILEQFNEAEAKFNAAVAAAPTAQELASSTADTGPIDVGFREVGKEPAPAEATSIASDETKIIPA